MTKVAKEIMVRSAACAQQLRHYFLVVDIIDSLKFGLALYLMVSFHFQIVMTLYMYSTYTEFISCSLSPHPVSSTSSSSNLVLPCPALVTTYSPILFSTTLTSQHIPLFDYTLMSSFFSPISDLHR